MRPVNRAASWIRCRAALWLALCVFVLKALVPQGFMPGIDPSTAWIQVCSASGPIWVQGPTTVAHDQHSPLHDASHDAQHAEQSAVCPAGAAFAALPLLPPLMQATRTDRQPLVVTARAPPAGIDATPLSAPVGARAPPLCLA